MGNRTEAMPQRFGPFVLQRLLGVGGMGKAYLARHPAWPARLVVKRMREQYLRDEVAFKRFLHEAKASTLVRHPSVASTMAVGTVENEPFFATEYVFGIALSELIDRIEESKTSPPPIGVVLYLALDLVKAVEAIHRATDAKSGEGLGLIHRDVGSRNALVGYEDGRLSLIDLGLGKSILSDWETAADTVAGSPDYMPPEQALGKRVDARADIYSAAVTVWELLAGRKRIRAKKIADRLQKAIEAQPEVLRPHRSEVTPELEAKLMYAMVPDPDGRMPDISELRRGLEVELSLLPEPSRRSDVISWLAVACATAIAAERKALEEADRISEDELDPPTRDTRIFAAQPDAFVPASRKGDDLEHRLESSPEDSAPPEEGTELAEEEADRISRWVGIAALVAGLLLLAVVLVLRSGGENDDKSSSTTAAQPVPPPDIPNPDLVAPPPAPKPQVEEVPEADDSAVAPEPIPEPMPELRPHKRALAKRLGKLRRVRFDVAFQRRLTELGKRVSRARSEEELDRVEGRIRALEKQQ